MELNRLLEITDEKEMCDHCVDGSDAACFACGKAKGIRTDEMGTYYAAVKAALRRTAEDDCRKCIVTSGAHEASGKHIRDLLAAEEEGRLVELPCRVGQTVYDVNLPDEFAEVCEYTVQDVSTKEIMFCDDWYPLSVIGKTVFLTRGEAEAALGGGEGG